MWWWPAKSAAWGCRELCSLYDEGVGCPLMAARSSFLSWARDGLLWNRMNLPRPLTTRHLVPEHTKLSASPDPVRSYRESTRNDTQSAHLMQWNSGIVEPNSFCKQWSLRAWRDGMPWFILDSREVFFFCVCSSQFVLEKFGSCRAVPSVEIRPSVSGRTVGFWLPVPTQWLGHL